MKRPWALVLGGALAVAAVTAGALAATHWRDGRGAADLARALAAPPGETPFDPADLEGLPEPARRYLAAALAPGTRPARSVRLEMAGRMRLGTEWVRLLATEHLAADGFVWAANLDRDGTPIRVWDSLGPEGGATRAWLMSLVPVARASGPMVTRSATGRLAAELIWLPSALLPGPGVRWEAVDADTARVRLAMGGRTQVVTLQLDTDGHPTAASLTRWGDPDGDGVFEKAPFGAELGGFRAFGGHTIPTRVRVGWGFGTDAFAPFFEVEVTAADFSGRGG